MFVVFFLLARFTGWLCVSLPISFLLVSRVRAYCKYYSYIRLPLSFIWHFGNLSVNEITQTHWLINSFLPISHATLSSSLRRYSSNRTLSSSSRKKSIDFFFYFAITFGFVYHRLLPLTFSLPLSSLFLLSLKLCDANTEHFAENQWCSPLHTHTQTQKASAKMCACDMIKHPCRIETKTTSTTTC